MPATYTPLADSTQLLLNTPTPVMEVGRHVTPSTSSSSNPGSVKLGRPTELLVSLTAVLGVAVLAIAAVLCWMRRWQHARGPRATRAPGRTQLGAHSVAAGLRHPGRANEADVGQTAQQARTGRAAAAATRPVLAPRVDSISDDSTIMALEGCPSKAVYQVTTAGAEGGVGTVRPPTIRSTADTDPGSVRAPSFRARLYAFFAGTRTEGRWVSGSVEDGRDPPPAYEPHVLPEYGALA